VTIDLEAAIRALDPAGGIRIDGVHHHAEATFSVEDPATETVIALIADGGVAEATAAVDAASAAFSSWSNQAPRERAEILRRVYVLMISDHPRLTALICAENGKSQEDAYNEVVYAAEFFRWFSEEAVRTDGVFSLNPSASAHTIVTHHAVGPAALVTPWNFPAAMAARKLAPALAAGCTTVLKPAAETPLTALAITELLAQAGVPDGVVNLVPTSNAAAVVSTWLSDNRIRKLSFTGSTGVGRALLRQTADRVVNTSMELGGNAPFIVTADADLNAAVAGAMVAKFRGGGQACTAANRFYIHAAAARDFLEDFSAAVERLRVGPACDPASQVGPMISARAADAIRARVDEAICDGARIAAQAEVSDVRGHFLAPTVLCDVLPGAAILRHEIFGPVAPVVVWEDESEMLQGVNDTDYGLAAYVYAGRQQDAMRIAGNIDAGMVGINRAVVSDPSAPFGGTKQSGLGREGARVGLREFQETQYFSLGDL
jgi:succinate-semialdehyde dehydrogenase/glutarate-semialdehyde dehydrogenase